MPTASPPHPALTAPPLPPVPHAPPLADAGRSVRVTLHPGTDVLLEVGTRLGDARAALAALACRPELLTAPLMVDGVRVDDDQRCGTRPLLPGGVVTVAAGGGDVRAVDVLSAPWHVAVLGGPDAGRLVPVATSARGRVAVDGLDVCWRTTRRGPRLRVRVPRGTRRTSEDAALTATGRRVAWWRPVRWRAGRALVSRDAVHALRPRPVLEHGPRTGRPDPAAGGDGPGRPWTAHLATALTPAIASLALAVTFRQPLYALLALAGPLALLVPALLDARRRRRAARQGGPSTRDRAGDPPGTGPGTGSAAAPVVPVDPLHPRPADVLTWATVAQVAPARPPRHPGSRSGGPDLGTATDDRASTPAARLPDGCVAVVGPRGAALAATRAVLAELLASGATLAVRHPPRTAHEWAWCRWLPRATSVRRLDAAVPARADADVLVVDHADASPGALGELAGAWERLGPAGTDLLLVLDERARVPAWCRTVLDVSGPTAVLTGPDGVRTTRAHVGVSTTWALALARRLAAAAHLGRLGGTDELDHETCDPTAPSLPADVSLGALLGTPAAHDELAGWVAERWRDAPRRDGRGLRCTLGTGVDGAPVTVDLVADGPHVLVAGTTGAGKSELLQTLVAGLALGRSPAEVTFALVDFKGGASFGACGRLPHVVGQVTDLDPGLAGRALAGLRAELHRRERVLAEAGVASVDELPAGRLPRLVVVVDEFRALADDLPDLLPGLLRVAAQGRSLGVHLVLATQRPSGAVSADVRANITLRLALRVVDVADSRDVVESPHAALVPASAPGRLVLRRGAEPPVALQCARAGAPLPRRSSGARLAPAWGAAAPAGSALDERAGTEDRLALLVSAAREVAAHAGLRTPPPPWLPALPSRVTAADLPTVADAPGGPWPTGDALLVALGDLPAQQRRAVVRWDPRDGHLAVLGRARSGRTTALRAVAHAALGRGWTVHAVGPGFADLAAHPGTGTLVDRSDPRRLARLLRLLAGHDDGQERPPGRARQGRVLVLVDDVEAVRSALSALAGGAGADLLADALADSGAAFAVSGSGPTVAGLAALVGVRAVLASRDRHDDASLGVPTAFAGQGGPAGRAVWLGPAEPMVCQVVLPESSPPAPHGRAPAGAEPVRLLRLPDRVEAATLRAAEDAGAPVLRVPVGRGGDDGAALAIDASQGALVVGPPGSGRTSTLTLLARHAARAGVLRGLVTRDVRLGAVAGPGVPVVTRHAPADVARLLDLVARDVGGPPARGTGAATGARPEGRPAVVVVDDLDLLAQLCVLEADRLAALCRDGLVLLASATTTAAAMALRGPLADVRGVRAGIVLTPGERGSSEVFGHGLEWLGEPGRPRPGRGVVVQGARLAPVQVALP